MNNFLEIVQHARHNPTEANFADLRQAYMQSDAYRPTSHFSANKLRGNTNGLNSFEEVVEFCETMLDGNPMDLEVWMLLAFAAEKTNQAELVKRADNFIKGMLTALFATGDGQSIKTAYQVIAVAEEYTALSVQGLKSQGQQLLIEDECYYDVLNCQPRGASEDDLVRIHFDITTPYLYLQNMLE